MSNALPFISTSVQPAYQHGQCTVAWRRTVQYQDHGVLVYRSLNGIDDWQLLNLDEEPITVGEQFLDTTLPLDTKLDRVHYRLVLEDPKTGDLLVDQAETLAFFEHLSRADYKASRRMMVAEVQRLRTGAAVPAFLVMPRRAGVPPGIDPKTLLVADNCTFEASGGSGFGFGVAAQTWVQMMALSFVQQDAKDGTTTVEVVETPARLPGFPQPVRGMLVVLPLTDDRFVVGESITPFAYRGVVPIAYQVMLSRLGRQDPRYRVPIPRLDRQLALPSFTRTP